MKRQEWNRLKPSQRLSILYVNSIVYYSYYNSQCSWGKLTEHVQNLLSQIEVVL